MASCYFFYIRPISIGCSRTDVSELLESRLKTDVMLVTGTLASHLHTVHTMAAHLNKTKSTLVQIDGVGDVLNEAVSSPMMCRCRADFKFFVFLWLGSRRSSPPIWCSSFKDWASWVPCRRRGAGTARGRLHRVSDVHVEISGRSLNQFLMSRLHGGRQADPFHVDGRVWRAKCAPAEHSPKGQGDKDHRKQRDWIVGWNG